MRGGQRFTYIEAAAAQGSAGALPYVPIALERDGNFAHVTALVDSGATLNVLPYDVGLQLGASWEAQTIPVQLTGNLAESEARAILLDASVGQFAPVRLAFAWTRNNQVPVILGQVNFFMEFDVCFFRSELAFEIRARTDGG